MSETEGNVLNPFAAAPIVAAPSTGSQMAVIAREVAEMQTMMLLAQQFPRDPRKAMDLILKECTRPALADAAIYEYAKGGATIEGPSIRLAEVLARGWGNIDSGIIELSRGRGSSEAMAQTVDLESRTRHFIRFQVPHWIDTKKGGRETRDDREVYELVANMGARRKRATILAVIPGDVVDAALHQCEVTLRTKLDLTKESLEKMVTAYSAVGVPVEALEKFIQRRLESITPGLFLRLRRIYNSIKDGMSSPDEWFEIEQPRQQPEGATQTERVKDQLRKRTEFDSTSPPAGSQGSTTSPTSEGAQTGPAGGKEVGEPEESFEQLKQRAVSAMDEAYAASDREKLKQIYVEVDAKYRARKKTVPLPVEAKYRELMAALTERGAQ